MSEIFNSFLKNIYIPAREKTKSFFLMIRTPIRIIKNIIFSAFIVYVIFNYSKIIETFIPNVFKFITTHTWESAIVLFILLTIKNIWHHMRKTYSPPSRINISCFRSLYLPLLVLQLLFLSLLIRIGSGKMIVLNLNK